MSQNNEQYEEALLNALEQLQRAIDTAEQKEQELREEIAYADYDDAPDESYRDEEYEQLDNLSLESKLSIVLHQQLNAIIEGNLIIESGQELKAVCEAVAIREIIRKNG
jgi:hypothetical protein